MIVNQSLNFIDENWVCNINLSSPLSKSGTYPFKVFIGNEELFYGNKYVEIGQTKVTFNITDILHFTRWIPKWSELNNSLNITECNLTGVVRVVLYDKDSGEELRDVYVSYGNIFRYPHRLADLEIPFGDFYHYPPYQQYASGLPVVNSMLQGMKYNENNVIRGQISQCEGYRLMPRVPALNKTTYFPIVIQYYSPTPIQTEYPFFSLHSRYFDANKNVLPRTGSITLKGDLISEKVNTSYLSNSIVKYSEYNTLYLGVFTNTTQSVPSDKSQITLVAQVDNKPEGYYLMWQDRYGSFQSQPFCKGNTYTESFDVSKIKEYTNKSRIIQTNITPSFEINSCWISEEYYPYYESIFISPVLVLTDVETEIQYEVIIKDKQYTEKTFRNQGRKMFNLKLTLELAKPQQITY